MYRDPELKWDDEFPYDVLTDAGITYESSSPQIRKARLKMARSHPQIRQEVHQAVSVLATSENRLFVDFFLYRTNPDIPSEDQDD